MKNTRAHHHMKAHVTFKCRIKVGLKAKLFSLDHVAERNAFSLGRCLEVKIKTYGKLELLL